MDYAFFLYPQLASSRGGHPVALVNNCPSGSRLAAMRVVMRSSSRGRWHQEKSREGDHCKPSIDAGRGDESLSHPIQGSIPFGEERGGGGRKGRPKGNGKGEKGWRPSFRAGVIGGKAPPAIESGGHLGIPKRKPRLSGDPWHPRKPLVSRVVLPLLQGDGMDVESANTLRLRRATRLWRAPRATPA